MESVRKPSLDREKNLLQAERTIACVYADWDDSVERPKGVVSTQSFWQSLYTPGIPLPKISYIQFILSFPSFNLIF